MEPTSRQNKSMMQTSYHEIIFGSSRGLPLNFNVHLMRTVGRPDTALTIDKLEILPGRMYFSIIASPLRYPKGTNAFSVDTDPQFQYVPFYTDFGPPSLLHIHKFVRLVRHYLEKSKDPIHFYCSSKPQKVANAVCFVSAFRLIHLECTPDEAFEPVKQLASKLKPYRDATTIRSMYDLTVYSCIKGLHRAMGFGWYKFNTFNAEHWEYYEKVEHGDMNWLIPDKLLAFASPYNTNLLEGMYRVSTPNDLALPFAKMHINHVIRLCKPCYDATLFKRQGLIHTDLIFDDGTNPPPPILAAFLRIAESKDIIALHCQAGLGRTGTLAACYMIKNYGFAADEAMGWIRLCRPGSVIGPQQIYLLDYEKKIRKEQKKNLKVLEQKYTEEVQYKHQAHAHTRRVKRGEPPATPKRTTSRNDMDGSMTPQPRKFGSFRR